MKIAAPILILYLMSLLPLAGDAQQNQNQSPADNQQRAENQPLVAGANTAVVPTTYGKLRGYIHNGIYTFKGIPYATARRFMAPQKPTPWEGIRSSMTYGPTCPTLQQVPMKDEFEFPLN